MSATPLVVARPGNVGLLAAEIVANRLRARPRLRLVLPAGRTPLGMYAALRERCADHGLRCDEATLFQLDEYQGLDPGDRRSYRAYLRRELAGVRFARVHGLKGTAPVPEEECARHQASLDEAPIDLVVLGLGRDGHVAFDEPGSPVDGGVRRVRLHETTRSDAAAEFAGLEHVPLNALTIGLRTLLAARELLLLATGEEKAHALHAMLKQPRGPQCPASLLRDHPRLTVVCDPSAARCLRSQPAWTSDRAIIVLGHREPSSSEHRISDESRARLARAEELCRADLPRVAVLTGYTRAARGLSEAEQMGAEWSLRGVPALLEDAGRSTAENATCSLPMILAIGDVRRVTVVTSAWHVRAPYLFAPYRKLGLDVSFGRESAGPWLRPLLSEARALASLPRQRRRALAGMRLPAPNTNSAENTARPTTSSTSV